MSREMERGRIPVFPALRKSPASEQGARLHKRQAGVDAVGSAGEIGRMARPLRIDLEDGRYHVMTPGIERRAIFADDENRWRGKHEVEFDAVVAAVEKLKGEAIEAWGRRYGDTGKWIVLTVASRRTRLTQRELGRRMGGMDYSAVNVGLRRFEARLKRDETLRRDVAKVDKMCNVET